MLNPILSRATRLKTNNQEIHLGAELLGMVLTSTQKQAVQSLFDTASSTSIILNDFVTDVTATVTSS